MSETVDLDNLSDEELRAAMARRGKSVVIEPDGSEVSASVEIDTKSGTDVEKKEPWTHGTLEFLGDTLEVRTPTDQALAAVSLSSGKYVPQKLQNDLVSLFIKNHMSEDSFERVFFRLLDPEDTVYTPASMGTLMGEIAKLNIEGKRMLPSGNGSAPAS